MKDKVANYLEKRNLALNLNATYFNYVWFHFIEAKEYMWLWLSVGKITEVVV